LQSSCVWFWDPRCCSWTCRFLSLPLSFSRCFRLLELCSFLHRTTYFPAQQYLYTNAWDPGNQGTEHMVQLRTLHISSSDLRGSSDLSTRPHLRFPGFHDFKTCQPAADKLEHASGFLSSLQAVRTKGIIVHSKSSRSSEHRSTMLSQFFATFQEKCDSDNLESFTRVNLDLFMSLHAYRNSAALTILTGYDIFISDKVFSRW
jgi:hypothetical protein